MTHQEARKRRQKMAELVAQGNSYNEVARKMGVSVNTVADACRLHGVSPPRIYHRVTRNTIDVLEVLFHILNGEISSSVARRFGVSRQRIHQIVVRARAAGFKIPSRRGKKRPKRKNVKT